MQKLIVANMHCVMHHSIHYFHLFTAFCVFKFCSVVGYINENGCLNMERAETYFLALAEVSIIITLLVTACHCYNSECAI